MLNTSFNHTGVNHLCGGKYIASGSYGCVFNPAIYFPGGINNYVDGKEIKEYSQVTRENRYDYVTKITLVNDFEFDIVDKIIVKFSENNLNSPFDLATTPIWVPIEKFCVSLEDFDAIVNQLDVRELKKDNACPLLVKVIESYKLKLRLKDRICFNNSFKYDFDLSKYTNSRDLYVDDLYLLKKDLQEKLNLINSIGIFNLDIKDLNIAVKSFGSIKKAYFTDWDLAFVEPSGSTLEKLEAYNSYIVKKYGSYEDEHNRVNFYITRLPSYGGLFLYLKNLGQLKDEEAFKKELIKKLFSFLIFKKFGYVAYTLDANKINLSSIKNEQKLNIYRACFKRIDAFCLMIIFRDKYNSIKQIFDYLDVIE